MTEEKKGSVESLLQYYYSFVVKKSPKKDDYDRSFLTIRYLIENDIDYLEVLNFLKKQKDMAITMDHVPDSFWNGSLIRRNAFYLHRELVNVAPPPKFNISTMEFEEKPFYYEVKIRYTEDDVVDYFYSHIKALAKLFADRKADKKTVAFLMKKYGKLDYVEPLDVILCLIDVHMEKDPECSRLIEISDDAIEVIKELQFDMQQLESEDRRQLVWRSVE